MKVIGLIGGMSWESTAVYYRLINEFVKEMLGGLHSCECLMYSVDFGPMEQLQREDRWAELSAMMIDIASRLQKGGAEMLVICSNTMHKCAADVQEAVDLPLLHIADTTAAEIQAASIATVGLLGTRYTTQQDFYKGILRDKHGIEVLVPVAEEAEQVHRIILDELVLGQIHDHSKETYKRIMNTLIAKGAKGIVLGCTEIPMLIKASDCTVPVFDTTRIHARKAVELALR